MNSFSMENEDCQTANIVGLFSKSSIIRIEQIIVKSLRKIKFYLLVRSMKNFLGLKHYYYGQKNTNTVSNEQPVKQQASFIKEGDVVKIKSKEEILKTLNENNKLEGCFFIQEMFGYCGSEQKVKKKVEYFFDEATNKMRKARTTFLLEGLHCSGKLTGYWTKCDRNCFLFWKEAWLEKKE